MWIDWIFSEVFLPGCYRIQKSSETLRMEKLRLREAGSESWEVAEPEVKNSRARTASVSCSAQGATLALEEGLYLL